MNKSILLKVSGAVAATLMLGSGLSATAFAGTTNGTTTAGTNGSHVRQSSIKKSYDRSVLILIHQLQERMKHIQSRPSISRRTLFGRQPGIRLWPWMPGNLMPDLATDLGISKVTLQSDLQSGQTIAQMASKHHVSTAKLISQLESAEASQLQADIKRFESMADKSIKRFVTGTKPKRSNPGGPMIPAAGSQSNPGGPMIPAAGSQSNPGGPMIPAAGSQSNPGGPMIPAAGSQSNPGGPMIPAAGSQSNPGGPMIPAAGSQSSPGGPMIPASSGNSTDANAYNQLVNTANALVSVLETEQNNGASSSVTTNIHQANAILNTLKASFNPSRNNTQHTSSTTFTATQLTAVQTATQSLEKMVKASGISTNQGNHPISTQSYATATEAANQIASIQGGKLSGEPLYLGHGITAKVSGAMGHARYEWTEGNWAIEVRFMTMNHGVKQVAENMVSYLDTHTLPIPNNHGVIIVNSTNAGSTFKPKTTIAWQEGTKVNELQQTGSPIQALETVVNHK